MDHTEHARNCFVQLVHGIAGLWAMVSVGLFSEVRSSGNIFVALSFDYHFFVSVGSTALFIQQMIYLSIVQAAFMG